MGPTAWVQTVVLPLTSHKKTGQMGYQDQFSHLQTGDMTLPTSKGWL